MTRVRSLNISDGEELAKLYSKNRENLRPFEPIRADEFYTHNYQRKLIEKTIGDKSNYLFGIFDNNKLIGKVSLSNIVRGAFYSAHLGYWIDEDYRNKGYMTEAVKEVISYGFEIIGLHRIEANVMPHNISSIKVLEKCGFERIGLAKKYLYINGQWQDHVMFQLINNNHQLK